jgi:hypothetical protein
MGGILQHDTVHTDYIFLTEFEFGHKDSIIIQGKSDRKSILILNKISERDKVFMYDYRKDELKIFKVKNLDLITITTEGYNQTGLRVDHKSIGSTLSYTVFIGNKNPFTRGKMKNIVWKQIHPKLFPKRPVVLKDSANLNGYFRWEKTFDIETGSTYYYESDKSIYYLQELVSQGGVTKRLLVIDRVSKITVYDNIYFDGGEVSYFPGATEQWTGKLFKKRPDVVLDIYGSFCDRIGVLDMRQKDFYVLCSTYY